MLASPRLYYLLSRSRRSSLKVIRPTLLLRPSLLIVRLGMNLELLKIRIDDFLTAIRADRCGLRWLDGQTVGLDGGSCASGVGFAVVALDL